MEESRSGSFVEVATWDGLDVVIKRSPRDSRSERELAVYDELEPPVATPLLYDHHETSTGITLILERGEAALPARLWTEARWTRLAYALARLHAYVPPDVERWTWTEPTPPVDVDALWADERNLVAQLDRTELEAAAGDDVVFSHGDCHLANTVFGPFEVDGQPFDPDTLALIDWQSARMAPACTDLAFAFTRAAATGAVVPRAAAITRYAARRRLDPVSFERAVTARQLLTLVWEYPAYASYLAPAEVAHLRRTFRELRDRWTSSAVGGSG